MAFAKYHDVIHAFPADRTDQPFCISVLPRRARRRRTISNTDGPNSTYEYFAVCAIAVPDQVTRDLLPATSLSELVGDPFTVGCAVTPNQRICRRPWPMISNPYSSRNEIVGTTKRSIAAIPSAWLQRNVFHPCEGGALLRAIYLATLVWPISMPSLRSSPWTLGAPHNGLAVLISRISRRISKGTVGRPRRRLDFQRQYDRNPERCQRITVSGRTIANASLTMGNSRQAPANISLSMELKGSFLGQARRSTLSCCLSTTISASSAARDRKRSTITPKNNLLHSDIEQQHRPILCQSAGSDLRQGHQFCFRPFPISRKKCAAGSLRKWTLPRSRVL